MSGDIPLHPLRVFMVCQVETAQISRRRTVQRWFRVTILYQLPEDTPRHTKGGSTLMLRAYQAFFFLIYWA